MSRDRWEQRYTEGDLPWDTGMPCEHLQQVVAVRPIEPCRALEIGCGTGTNAIWLAQQGFQMTALDISENAIGMARRKAKEAGVECCLASCDFAGEPPESRPFRFAYDLGCFHSMATRGLSTSFALNLAGLLEEDGLWLSLIGSADGPPREAGPPARSALEIAMSIEPFFEILQLEAVQFRRSDETSATAWACLSRKRRTFTA